MDWFHCNKCFTARGSNFAVSSCGHIFCETCIQSKQCSVCGSSCRYLPITDKIAHFQQTQIERVTTHYRHKSIELELRLKEVTEQAYRQLSNLQRENSDLKRQLSELRRETTELRKPLSQRRASPGQSHIDGSQRISLPVAVTSPVTPRLQSLRDRGSSLSSLMTPESAISTSSHSSIHENRTPASFRTPTRTQPQASSGFQNQLMSGLLIHSPRR
ncbi:E3 ubiquitin-protein ligase RNF212B-like isoform X3 [Nelusetta ayraudi]|uniref:E3 ubiquitin-protein ligase RNF212B-like isoform X3 n=1 Tax=Nelusetta ayraudi TaxID=303726 RepID=UPI003F71CD17